MVSVALRSNCPDAHADLELRCPQMACAKCRGKEQYILITSESYLLKQESKIPRTMLINACMQLSKTVHKRQVIYNFT